METLAEMLAIAVCTDPDEVDRYDVLGAKMYLQGLAKLLADEELVERVAIRLHDGECKVPWADHAEGQQNEWLLQSMDTLDALRDEILEDPGGRGEKGNKGS